MHSIAGYNHVLTLLSDNASLRIVEDAFKDKTDARRVLELPYDNVQISDNIMDTEHAVQPLHSNPLYMPSSNFKSSMDEGNLFCRIYLHLILRNDKSKIFSF